MIYKIRAKSFEIRVVHYLRNINSRNTHSIFICMKRKIIYHIADPEPSAKETAPNPRQDLFQPSDSRNLVPLDPVLEFSDPHPSHQSRRAQTTTSLCIIKLETFPEPMNICKPESTSVELHAS